MKQLSLQPSRKSIGIFALLATVFLALTIASYAQKSYNVTMLSPAAGSTIVKDQKYTLQFKITNTGMMTIPMGDTVMVDVSVDGKPAYTGGTILMTPMPMGASQSFTISNFAYSGITANSDNGNLCVNIAILHNTNSGTSKNCQTMKLRMPSATSVAGQGRELVLLLYPNPANDRLQIQCAAGFEGIFQLYDLSGREQRSLQLKAEPGQLETSDLPAGMYFYRVSGAGGSLLQSGRLQITH